MTDAYLLPLPLLIAFAISFAYRDEVFHPCFWMPPFIAIYGSWYQISQFLIMGLVPESHQASLILVVVGLIGFVLPAIIIKDRNCTRNAKIQLEGVPVERSVAYVILLGMALVILSAYLSSAVSKRDVVDGVYNEIPLLSPIFVLFHFYLVRIFALSIKRKAYQFCSFLYLMAAVLALLVMGERNFLFSFALIWLMYFLASKSPQAAVFGYFLSVGLVVVLMPVTQLAKAILLSEPSATFAFVDSIMKGEFFSQGRNLVLILESPPELSGVEVLIKEITRGLAFSLFGSDAQGMASWFNKEYRVDQGLGGNAGWGFSLIASGYLMFGYYGVFAVFVFVSSCLLLIYKRAYANNYFATLYLCLIPVNIYVMRQDLSYFIGDLVKYSLIAGFLVVFLSWLINNSVAAYDSEN